MTDDALEEKKATSRVIVAIPAATEPVHHMGDVSEPKHLTLVYLGKPEDNPSLDMDQVKGQVQAVAERSGPLTGLVESVGPLGDDNATVLFLRGDGLHELHDDLLAQSYIRDGFGAVEQFPQWTPHTTLGYDLDEPVSEADAPEEIVFDRLAVWNGEERTEYPLGSSSVPTVPEPEESAFEQELIAAVTRPATAKLPVCDAESLAKACSVADQLTDETSKMATRRALTKRARELGCQHLIPSVWVREAAMAAQKSAKKAVPTQPSSGSASTARNVTDASTVLSQKTQLTGLPDTALRTAYVRGVREFTMTAPHSRPPLPRDLIAQARVNSLIRLSQGDLSARSDDRDLLP